MSTPALGVLVVYICPPGSEWLLRLHLDQIKATTSDQDYRIFAVAPRVSDAAKAILERDQSVTLIAAPSTDHRMSREHGFYLDHLVGAALSAGVDHIATFDMDAFPVRPGWADDLGKQLSDERPLASVFREENGDTCLPHPSGMLARAGFFKDAQPSFYPETLTEAQRAMLAGRQQRIDTGIGLALALLDSGKDWVRLRRSNARNVHPMIAGVYGDVFFHLGAAGRPPVFFADFADDPMLGELYNNRDAPSYSERFKAVAAEIAHRNQGVVKEAVAALKADPRAFVDFLRRD